MKLAMIQGMAQPRPFIPAKTYYLELNGVPSCCSPCHPKGYPAWSCAQSSHKEAQQEALLVWRDHPDCTITIKEGPCPRSNEIWDDQMERMWEDY